MKTRSEYHQLITWKLSPIEENSPLWRASRVRGEQLVRAHGSTQARALAAESFKCESDTIAGQVVSPWLDARLVTCSRVYAFSDVDQPGVIFYDSWRRHGAGR
jgi:hypothetical protein